MSSTTTLQSLPSGRAILAQISPKKQPVHNNFNRVKFPRYRRRQYRKSLKFGRWFRSHEAEIMKALELVTC